MRGRIQSDRLGTSSTLAHDVELVRTPSRSSEQTTVDNGQNEDAVIETESLVAMQPSIFPTKGGLRKAMSHEPLLPANSNSSQTGHGSITASRSNRASSASLRRSSFSIRTSLRSDHFSSGFEVPSIPSAISQDILEAEDDIIAEEALESDDAPIEDEPPDNSVSVCYHILRFGLLNLDQIPPSARFGASHR